MVLGYFTDEDAAAEFGAGSRDAGVALLDLAVEPVGVRAANGLDERSV